MDATEHRQLREQAGLNQAELAGILGISQVAVSQRESDGDRNKPVPERDALLLRYVARYGPPDTALAHMAGTIAENIPGALAIAAKAMGVTTGQLAEALARRRESN